MRMRLLIVVVFTLSFLSTAHAADYLIGDGDTLQISVWGEPDLSASVIVRPDGMITLPAVGDIKASGYRPQELAERLKE
ncbi:MAG TPA: sugar ABC transporter substrate-binding protein, partial [Nitrospirae bacterium]|nr:sugar ABC transporter substrate-binding protein [Nitrospirota bacterium]